MGLILGTEGVWYMAFRKRFFPEQMYLKNTALPSWNFVDIGLKLEQEVELGAEEVFGRALPFCCRC